jgi:hypothetical protein
MQPKALAVSMPENQGINLPAYRYRTVDRDSNDSQ